MSSGYSVRTRIIATELRIHAPFTAFGTVTGIVIMALIVHTRLSREVSASLFWTFHPLHVVLSAFVTAAMYRLHGNRGLGQTLTIGYVVRGVRRRNVGMGKTVSHSLRNIQSCTPTATSGGCTVPLLPSKPSITAERPGWRRSSSLPGTWGVRGLVWRFVSALRRRLMPSRSFLLSTSMWFPCAARCAGSTRRNSIYPASARSSVNRCAIPPPRSTASTFAGSSACHRREVRGWRKCVSKRRRSMWGFTRMGTGSTRRPLP
jgi:hypothetical protein